jgi:hypothetical protein
MKPSSYSSKSDGSSRFNRRHGITKQIRLCDNCQQEILFARRPFGDWYAINPLTYSKHKCDVVKQIKSTPQRMLVARQA